MKSVNVPELSHDISSTLSQCPGTLDEAVDLYNTALKDLMELHAPLKQRSVVRFILTIPGLMSTSYRRSVKGEKPKRSGKHQEVKMIRIIIKSYAIK